MDASKGMRSPAAILKAGPAVAAAALNHHDYTPRTHRVRQGPASMMTKMHGVFVLQNKWRKDSIENWYNLLCTGIFGMT
jgi:hypothetical protein